MQVVDALYYKGWLLICRLDLGLKYWEKILFFKVHHQSIHNPETDIVGDQIWKGSKPANILET